MINKHLLNANSIFFRSFAAFTGTLCIINLFLFDEDVSVFSTMGFKILTLLVFALTAFAIIPWYGTKFKGLGIEIHFEKIWLATIYTFFIQNILYITTVQIISINILLSILYVFFIVTNTILLRLHFLDKDTTPPNFYSKNIE